MSDQDSTRDQLFHMIIGHMTCRAIYVAAKLGIADLLTNGPKDVDSIASQTNSDPESLYRLLRALAGAGVFVEVNKKSFDLTPMAKLLTADSPDSLKSVAMMVGNTSYHIWGELMHSVETGEEAFEKVFGIPMFEYFTLNPEKGRTFDDAMQDMHSREINPMLEAYDFSSYKKIIDIGGGNGSLMTAITGQYPGIKGMVYDLPSVVERAREKSAYARSDIPCEFQGGDFFASVPAGGDLYIMRHIIHDWVDEKAITILENCRKAKTPDGKVVVIEGIVPHGNDPSFVKWLDVGMLLIGGKERTEEQFEHLFEKAGLELINIMPTRSGVSLIEGV